MATKTGKQLKNIGALWGKAKEEAKKSGFSEAVPLEAGKYTLQLFQATIGDFGDQRQVMLKWIVIGDSDDKGVVCTTWQSLAEDRVVWLLRLLTTMGVDLDEVQPETEDDLIEVFDKLIADNTAVEGKVREKDGYTNLYINKVADVETSDLIDPEEAREALKSAGKDGGKSGKSGKSGKGKEEEEPAEEPEAGDDAVELNEGDTVTWKDAKTKKTRTGEVMAFDKDDNALVRPEGEKKTVTLALDALEKVEEEGGEEPGEPEGSEDEAKEIEEGDVVIVEIKGKDKSGVVTKVKNGKVTVRVKGVSPDPTFKEEDVKHAVD